MAEKEKKYIEKFYRFTCADCAKTGEYKDRSDDARAHGWAIAAGGKECYCPACAFKHRNVGRKGAKDGNVTQIAFGEVGNA